MQGICTQIIGDVLSRNVCFRHNYFVIFELDLNALFFGYFKIFFLQFLHFDDFRCRVGKMVNAAET